MENKKAKKTKYIPTQREMIVYLYEVLGKSNAKLSDEIYVHSSNGLANKESKLERKMKSSPIVIKKYLESHNINVYDYKIMGLDDDFPEEINTRNKESFFNLDFKSIVLVIERNIA